MKRRKSKSNVICGRTAKGHVLGPGKWPGFEVRSLDYWGGIYHVTLTGLFTRDQLLALQVIAEAPDKKDPYKDTLWAARSREVYPFRRGDGKVVFCTVPAE